MKRGTSSKTGLIVLSVLLAISLAANFMLLKAAKELYAEKNFLQVFPVKATLETQPANDKPTLLLFGDSRIADWGLPQIQQFRTANYGLRGGSTAQLTSTCEDVLEKIKPDVVLIQAGINDLKLAGVKPELREQLVSGAVSNIMSIARMSRESGAEVMITPIWPSGPVGMARRVVWNSAVDEAISEANSKLKELSANQEKIHYIEISPIVGDGKTNLYVDTLHFNPQAYVQLTSKLQNALNSQTDKPIEK